MGQRLGIALEVDIKFLSRLEQLDQPAVDVGLIGDKGVHADQGALPEAAQDAFYSTSEKDS